MERINDTAAKAIRFLMLVNALAAIVLGLAFALEPQWMTGLLRLELGDRSTSQETLKLFRLLGFWLSSSGFLLWHLAGVVVTRGRGTLLLGLLAASTVIWAGSPVAWFAGMDQAIFLFLPFGFGLLCSALVLFARQIPAARMSDAGLASIDPVRAEAAQEERNRLARDLHDSIKQQLFSIKTSAAAAEARWENDPAGARRSLLDIRKSSHEAMVEMQALLLQLRPVALANVGLVEALREQCEALGYRSGAQVHFEVGQLPDESRLPRASQETLFRIAQEALSNVARHSRATSVRVSIGEVEQEGISSLLLSIEDDGQGFDPESETSGMGLRNMRDRLDFLAGTLTVESSPGHGARIHVLLPSSPPSQTALTGIETVPIAFLALMQGETLVSFWLPLLGAGMVLALEAVYRRRRSGGDVSWKRWWSLQYHPQLFFYFALAFWASPLFQQTGELTSGFWDRLHLGATVLAGLAATTEAVYLLWDWKRGAWSKTKPRAARQPSDESILLVIMAAFLLTLPFMVIVDEPGGLGRSATVASGLLYLGAWIKLKFQ